MQHSHSSVELKGASPTHSSPKRTRAAGYGPCGRHGHGLYPPEGVCFWAGILLWALVAPGACRLTAEMEDTIVELHNYYRGQVFPAATAMMPLKWDASLQGLAGGYVEQCTWQHNPQLTDHGENLYVTEGELDIQVALEQWFMEHLNYNYNNNSCQEDKMCGHYTQMVWADSHRVGCELHSCDVMQGLEIGPSQFLVCNYYPAGNYDDQKPYEEGDWCSRCPGDLQKCRNHMCVPDVEDEDEDVEDDEDQTPTPFTTYPGIVLVTEASPPLLSQDTPPTPSEDTPSEDKPSDDTPTEDTPTEDTPTEDTPTEDTPTEDTPTEGTPPESDSSPENVELPAHLAEEETVEEVPKEEEEQEDGEQKEEEPKEEEPKEEEPKEGETVEEAQKEVEKNEAEQKEQPKQTKLLIETKWEKTRETPSSGGRATSCSPYDNFLLLCLVGALVLRL
ncbi:peptidase inhibitor 16 [Gadus morhua]|uniref:peptidase inhibitor 16 n=1 Tax=Gadus morhua TaxID=8049 RepID=UPI0011B4B447|nr:peptidase inhibitor 16-like [Gadus morhua]